MGIPDPALETDLVSRARGRAADSLTAFAAEHGAEGEPDLVCTHVGVLFEDYCAGLREGLRAAVLPVEPAEAHWVRDHYVQLMLEFATALRDSIADSKARHAAAQLIQCKVLEHERELRAFLEPSSAAPAAELASAAPARSGS